MWFSLSPRPTPTHIGAIIDVGDTKIEVALVRSDKSKLEPNVVWTHVELFAHDRNSDTTTALRKAVFNSFAALGREGVKVLKQLNLPTEISLVQASLHAPYALTLSRTVTLKNEKPIKVTRSLVKELEDKANADALKIQSSKLVRSGLKLYPLSSAITALRLNGQKNKYPFNSSATEVSLSQHVVLATLDFVGILKDARDKYLPKTEIDADSFISLFSRTVSALVPNVSDSSLLTIGDGATEFMVVRDGLPQDMYYIPMGLDHIANEICRATGLLPHEAKGLTKDNAVDYVLLQTKDKKTAADDVLSLFEKELTSLLSKAGDSSSLPKPIFLQTECDHEMFFANMVDRVSKKVTGNKHTVHPITSEFFACRDVKDASLLSLAFAFHKKLYKDHYLDLR